MKVEVAEEEEEGVSSGLRSVDGQRTLRRKTTYKTLMLMLTRMHTRTAMCTPMETVMADHKGVTDTPTTHRLARAGARGTGGMRPNISLGA